MAIFELDDAVASAIPELMVGPWICAPPKIVAFDAGTGPPGSRWRVDLAHDDAPSWAALAGGERSVARTHAALDDVSRRFDHALGHALGQALGRPLGQAPRPGSARDDLNRAFAPEFSPESDLIAGLASAPEPGWLEQTLDRIVDLARGRARIETHVEGALVAHSVMTLSGDTEAWIAPRLSRSGVELHARSVAVAIRTRHAWARILTLIVASCGRMLALGLPAVGLTALPLVWRFVRGVLREAGDRKTAPRPA